MTNIGSEPDAGASANFRATPRITRRWTVIASGLLILALALVVIYTGANAFFSPVALVVVAAIGLAAVLLQLWFRREIPIHSPLWLNVLGIVCAIVSLFADELWMTQRTLDLWAFAAVICFGVSGSLILHSLRKKAATQPQSESK